jgi:hypothetical protein
MSTREKSKIESVFYGQEDHGILTCSVMISSGGGCQGFGQLCLDPITGPDFLHELCDVFDVHDHELLKGQECYALRNFEHYNCPIEGLEAMSGKRFTLTAFIRKHWPDKAQSPLERERQRHEQEIVFLQRRLKEERSRLACVDEGYVDWEVA